MSLPKLNKLYFPGLISLVFLPLMCIVYFVNNNTFHRYHMMKIAVAPRELINKWISVGRKKNKIETFRKYEVLNLTGDLLRDNKEFVKFSIQLNQLSQRKIDTTNGIKVSLGQYAEYGEFVNMLDVLLKKENQDISFDIIGNEIFIVHVAPPPKLATGTFYGDLSNDVVYHRVKPPFISMETINASLMKLYRGAIKFWPSVIAFFLMLLFAIKKKKLNLI